MGKVLRTLSIGAFFVALLQPSFLSGNTCPMKLVVLLNASELSRQEDVAKARQVLRDLLENLPPGVDVRIFRFGSRLVAVDSFQPDDIDKLVESSVSGKRKAVALRLALVKAEGILCQPDYGWKMSGKAIVILGTSSRMERPALRSLCQVNISVISISREGDQALYALAQRTGGYYQTLSKADGFQIGKIIRNMAAIIQAQLLKEDTVDPWRRATSMAGHSVALLLVIALMLRLYGQ